MKEGTHRQVMEKIDQLYNELFRHDGYGEIRIEMKILRRGQKEVIVHCGKQYRYVLDFQGQPAAAVAAAVNKN